ncbi:MAG: arginine deiminase-related protein [Oceanospirillaceae bacterium]
MSTAVSSVSPLAKALIMVRPVDFAYNEQTAVDNRFQHRPANANVITQQALVEFDNMLLNLRAAGIEVLVLEAAQPAPALKSITSPTPDAVFPNNWFSTTVDGKLIIYPMHTENRRRERRVADLAKLLDQQGYFIDQQHWLAPAQESQYILEGTGAVVIDHRKQHLYATQSERCHPQQLRNFAESQNYTDTFLFQTQSPDGSPIYHTNVMMSIGNTFAVICAQCFVDQQEYIAVRDSLASDREVIEISYQQMATHFCANILQLENSAGEPVIVMSKNAYQGFSEQQRAQLEQHGAIVASDISTIEDVGGGSARCMIAEIFLPKQLM